MISAGKYSSVQNVDLSVAETIGWITTRVREDGLFYQLKDMVWEGSETDPTRFSAQHPGLVTLSEVLGGFRDGIVHTVTDGRRFAEEHKTFAYLALASYAIGKPVADGANAAKDGAVNAWRAETSGDRANAVAEAIGGVSAVILTFLGGAQMVVGSEGGAPMFGTVYASGGSGTAVAVAVNSPVGGVVSAVASGPVAVSSVHHADAAGEGGGAPRQGRRPIHSLEEERSALIREIDKQLQDIAIAEKRKAVLREMKEALQKDELPSMFATAEKMAVVRRSLVAQRLWARQKFRAEVKGREEAHRAQMEAGAQRSGPARAQDETRLRPVQPGEGDPLTPVILEKFFGRNGARPSRSLTIDDAVLLTGKRPLQFAELTFDRYRIVPRNAGQIGQLRQLVVEDLSQPATVGNGMPAQGQMADFFEGFLGRKPVFISELPPGTTGRISAPRFAGPNSLPLGTYITQPINRGWLITFEDGKQTLVVIGPDKPGFVFSISHGIW